MPETLLSRCSPSNAMTDRNDICKRPLKGNFLQMFFGTPSLPVKCFLWGDCACMYTLFSVLNHCLMSGSDTSCVSFSFSIQTTNSQQSLAKDVRPFHLKNKWRVHPTQTPTHTALLNIIAAEIGKFCRNKHNMTWLRIQQRGQTGQISLVVYMFPDNHLKMLPWQKNK